MEIPTAKLYVSVIRKKTRRSLFFTFYWAFFEIWAIIVLSYVNLMKIGDGRFIFSSTTSW